MKVFFNTTSQRIIIFFILLFLSYGLPALADSVKMEVGDRQCVVGENLYFAIAISLDQEKEIDVSKVIYNNVPLRYEVRSQSNSSFTMIVNGKTVRQSSDMTKSYIFELETSTVGPISLPAYTIKVGDKEYRTEPLNFEVLAKPTSDNLLFITEVANKRDFYYPTQIVEVFCKIYYREFPSSPIINDIILPIINHRGFELIPPHNPDSKLVVNGVEFPVSAIKGRETLKGKSYNFFGFKLKFRLMDSGGYSFANTIKMEVETGRTYRQRSFFGSQLMREKETIYADSPPLAIQVNELPQENVPPSFNGAIGNFKIKAIPSSDTDIKVGDPITLTVEISGRGTWEFVKSPPIHKIREITDYFKVSEDLVAGEVAEDDTSKSFRIRMRVKSKTVKEIPAIPFTYFDLLALKYVTVYSDPIPISVFDATSKVQIVDFAKTLEPEVQENEDAKAVETMANSDLAADESKDEQYQPRLPQLIPISDNVGGEMLDEDHAPHYFMTLYAACPLLLVLILFLTKAYRGREKNAATIAREKAENAYNHFLNQCAHLEKEDLDFNEFYRDLGQNIHTFLEQRLMLPITELDRSFLEKLIDNDKISRPMADSLLSVVEKIDQRRYSKTDSNRQEALAILAEVKKVVQQC